MLIKRQTQTNALFQEPNLIIPEWSIHHFNNPLQISLVSLQIQISCRDEVCLSDKTNRRWATCVMKFC